MKFLAGFAVFLGLMSSLNAQAAGIICTNEMRPMDGPYTEVLLSQGKDGKFSMTETVITSGFGAPAQTIVTPLATGLDCNIDGLVAYCFASGSSTSNSNSLAKFTLIERTEINSLRQVGAEKSEPVISIEVFSPLINVRKQYEFLVANQWGGCEELHDMTKF